MQTFIAVSVSAVTVREGDGAAVRYIANTNAAQSLRAQNNGGGECISLDQFSYLNPNTNAHCVCSVCRNCLLSISYNKIP